MKKTIVQALVFLCLGILISIGGIYGLTWWQYRNEPQKAPVKTTESIDNKTVELSKNTGISQKVLPSGREVDNDSFFDLYPLEDYPNARLELHIEKGQVRIKIENRFDMYGEYYTLGTGESLTADIDQLIAKYKSQIGMVVLPLDRENGKFSLNYQIIQKD